MEMTCILLCTAFILGQRLAWSLVISSNPVNPCVMCENAASELGQGTQKMTEIGNSKIYAKLSQVRHLSRGVR